MSRSDISSPSAIWSSPSAIGRTAAGFWTWWTGELSAIFAPLGGRLQGRSGQGPLVSVVRSAEAEEDFSPDTARERSVGLDPDSWARLRARLAREKVAGKPLRLLLDPDFYLTRSADYPAGALARLDTIIDLDVEKATPFDRDGALWKWRVTGRAGASVTVETVILRRAHVMTLLERASGVGLEVAEILVPAPAGGARPSGRSGPLLMMRLTTRADRRRAFWRKVNTGLAVALVLLAAGWAGLSYFKRAQAHASVTEQVAMERDRAVRLRRAQAAAEERFETGAVVLREKARSPSLVAVWEDLSRTLPDDAWLTELRIADRRGRISGFASSAAPLIELLERLEGVSGVAFASPVTINPDNRSERFDITFILDDRPFVAGDNSEGDAG